MAEFGDAAATSVLIINKMASIWTNHVRIAPRNRATAICLFFADHVTLAQPHNLATG
jgi:hypothetical protein